MEELLAELEAALQSQSPPLTAAFAKPATEAAIRKAERKLDTTFPDDFRAFLLCANGQRTKAGGFSPVGDSIVPRIRFAPGQWGLSAWGYFLDLDTVVERTLSEYELDQYEEDDRGRKFIGPVTAHHRHVIITAADDPVSLALDLQPAEGGHFGQVITVNDQPDYTACLAPCLSAFLRLLIDGFLAGRFLREEDGTLTEVGRKRKRRN